MGNTIQKCLGQQTQTNGMLVFFFVAFLEARRGTQSVVHTLAPIRGISSNANLCWVVYHICSRWFFTNLCKHCHCIIKIQIK